MYKFKFADIGEGLHEGVVAKIYINEGQEVKEGDSLFSVETDKVTSDIPSPTNGIVEKVLMNVGDTIHVGDVIYHINDGSKENKEEGGAASVVGDIKVSNEIIDLNSLKSNSISKKGEKRKSKVASTIKLQDGILSTPLARSIAADKGIDITQVQGTGFNGRVLVKDIESFTPRVSTFAQQPFTHSREDIITKISPIRKVIAKAMKGSWETVAYTNLVNEVNMTKIWDERIALNDVVLPKIGVKLTFTAFAAKATAIALKDFPMLNAKYNDKKDEITQFGAVHLGLAVDTPKGLVVPIIRDVDTKSVIKIAQDIIDVATKARNGKLTTADMSGGTFTLTNYGSVGAMLGVPVINVGEMGILGTGAIVDRVFGDKNGNFYNGKVMNLTCAADHRWVDGADIGRFINKVKQLLENPAMIMMGVI